MLFRAGNITNVECLHGGEMAESTVHQTKLRFVDMNEPTFMNATFHLRHSRHGHKNSKTLKLKVTVLRLYYTNRGLHSCSCALILFTTTMTVPIGSTPVKFARGNLLVCRCCQRILLVAFSRPPVNAFDDHLYEDLIDLFQYASTDPTVSAIVLTGDGLYFSAGADVKQFNMESSSNKNGQMLHTPAGRFMMALLSFPKILGAAVQGPAVGIGVTLLMHCDLVHCSENATFWVPFTRLALVPELCSSFTFTETMGLSKANELLLLGEKIDAKKAVEWNICSKVVSDCDMSGDPFHPQSLASLLCNTIDERLLSLPHGPKTADYFVSLVRGKRRRRLEQVCREELVKLDERFAANHVQEAAFKLQLDLKREPRSKL
jgi:enoyl-CoA hydratase/carnithine racemase